MFAKHITSIFFVNYIPLCTKAYWKEMFSHSFIVVIENLKQCSYLKCSYLKMDSHGNSFFRHRARLRSCALDFHYSVQKICGKLGRYISFNEIHVLYNGWLNTNLEKYETLSLIWKDFRVANLIVGKFQSWVWNLWNKFSFS